MQPKHLAISIHDQISVDKLKLKYQKQMGDRERYDLENSVSKSTGLTLQKYYVEFKNYYNSQQVSSNCNDITFLNVGSNSVVIAGTITLQQNQSLQISGNVGELDTTEYQVQFTSYSSVNNNLVVIRKLYK